MYKILYLPTSNTILSYFTAGKLLIIIHVSNKDIPHKNGMFIGHKKGKGRTALMV